MTPNLHTPARLAGETFDAYRARRAASRRVVAAMTLRGIGNQRNAPTSREMHRDERRRNGNGPKGRYGADLMRYFARTAAQAKAAKLAARRAA
jgi:hypothetical protein